VSGARDLRYRAEAWAVRILLRGLSALPAGPAIAFASGVGRLSFLLWRSRRRVAVENITAAGICPDAESVERTALESFRTFTLMVVESFLLRRRFTPENWRNHITFHSSEETRRLLETPGQSLLLSSAHIGNWEAGIHAGSLMRPLVLVHRPLSNPHLQRVVFEERAGNNVSLLSSLDPDPFRFIEALSQGSIVALMTDQHAVNHRVHVQFFGRPAWTTKTLAMMHLSTRVPLISVFCIRTGPLQYDVHCSDPVRMKRSGDRDQDAQDLTQLLTGEVEKIARRFPAQYMWGHRRWKP
jgi:KDO2-lipid IV(A) lauroyltransferase